MPTEAPFPKDHPVMLAWDAYSATPEYTNSKYWAAFERHVDGSMFDAFFAGFGVSAPATRKDAGAAASANGLHTHIRLIEERVRKTICETFNTASGRQTTEARILADDFEVLILAALGGASTTAPQASAHSAELTGALMEAIDFLDDEWRRRKDGAGTEDDEREYVAEPERIANRLHRILDGLSSAAPQVQSIRHADIQRAREAIAKAEALPQSVPSGEYERGFREAIEAAAELIEQRTGGIPRRQGIATAIRSLRPAAQGEADHG